MAQDRESLNGSSSPVPLGGVAKFPAQFPPVYETNGERYLREGTFATSGSDPSLDFMKPTTMPFVFTGYNHLAVSSVTGVARKSDSDGQGLWITCWTGAAGKFLRTTDDFVTVADITSVVGEVADAICFIKHISGVGDASVWMLQTQSGLKRSVDGGQTWANVTTNGTGSSNPWIAVNGSTVLIAGAGNNGYYRRSTDTGVNFGTDVTLGGTTPRAYYGIHTVGDKFVICGSASFSGTVKPAIWVAEDATFGTAQNILPSASADAYSPQLIYSALTGRLYFSLSGSVTTYYTPSFTETTFGTVTFGLSHAGFSSWSELRLGEAGVFIVRDAGTGSSLAMYQEIIGQASLKTIGPIRSHSGIGYLEYGKNNKWLLMTEAGNPYMGVPSIGLYANTGTNNQGTNEARYMRDK